MAYSEKTTSRNCERIVKILEGGNADIYLIQEISKINIDTIRFCLGRLARDKKAFKIRTLSFGCHILWTLNEAESHTQPAGKRKPKPITITHDIPIELKRFCGLSTEKEETIKGRTFEVDDHPHSIMPLSKSVKTSIKSYYANTAAFDNLAL